MSHLSSSVSQGGVSNRTQASGVTPSQPNHHSGSQEPNPEPIPTSTQQAACPAQGSHAGVWPQEGGASDLGRAEAEDRAAALTLDFSFQEVKVPRFSLAPSLFPAHSISFTLITLSFPGASSCPPRHPMGLVKYHPQDSAHCLNQGSRNLSFNLQPTVIYSPT